MWILRRLASVLPLPACTSTLAGISPGSSTQGLRGLLLALTGKRGLSKTAWGGGRRGPPREAAEGSGGQRGSGYRRGSASPGRHGENSATSHVTYICQGSHVGGVGALKHTLNKEAASSCRTRLSHVFFLLLTMKNKKKIEKIAFS